MKEKTRQYLLVTAFGVCLYAALTHLPAVLDFLSELFQLIRPIAVGGVLAFFIYVPASGI